MKIWPDVCSALAAFLADEPVFDVGEPDIVRPLIGADRDVVAALVIAAIDQNAANAGFAHSPRWGLCMPQDSAAQAKGKVARVRMLSSPIDLYLICES